MINLETQEIVNRLVARTHSSEDLRRLIEITYSGEGLHLLKNLLESKDELLLADGAYILSEIGPAGKPLLPLALKLIRHRRQDVRYWAMNNVMSCADINVAKKTIEEAGLVSDPWELTRWAAARFLNKVNNLDVSNSDDTTLNRPE